MKQYFSWALLTPFITSFDPLLETEMFQRAVTPVNILLKDFILQITWLGDNLIRSSTFTVVIYWKRPHLCPKILLQCCVPSLFFVIALLQERARPIGPKIPVGKTAVCFLFGHCLNLFWHWIREQKTQFPHWKNFTEATDRTVYLHQTHLYTLAHQLVIMKTAFADLPLHTRYYLYL